MSETMSSPTDWAKFYQQNLSAAAAATPNASTGMMISSTNLSSPHGSVPSSSSNLSPNTEGRVSKPPRARRRSRASRRTPTTLLNTDTTNFRAMVQQFTGGSTVPFAATRPSQSSGFNPNPNPNPNPTSSVMFTQGYYRLQYQPQGYMISMSNVNSLGAAGEGFFQRLGGNPRPPLQPPEGSDGFLMEMNNATSSSRMPSNSKENRGNGFMF